MTKTNRMKKLVVRYAWAGPIIGFIAGFLFGPGVIGQIIDFKLKSHSVSIEQIKLKKEFFEKEKTIQDEITEELKHYYSVRDQIYKLHLEGAKNFDLEKNFWASLNKVEELTIKYNQLEDLYSSVDNKSAKYFDLSRYYKPLPLPLLPPKIIGVYPVTNKNEVDQFQGDWSNRPTQNLFFMLKSDPLLGSMTNLYKDNHWQ